MLDAVLLRPLTFDDAEAMLALRVRNREYFLTGEPVREEGFFTLDAQRAQMRALAGERAAGVREQFAVVEDDEIVGYVSLSQIFRGSFQNAYLGYAIGRDHAGRGLGTLAVAAAVDEAWRLGLHRVQANVATTNRASQRVMEKNGFRHEGTALRYLHIGGAWTDHHVYARTIED